MSRILPYLPYLFGFAGTILGPLITVWAYKRRAQVDLDTQSGQIINRAREEALKAQAVPIELLKAELSKRERELDGLRKDDNATRARLVTVLTKLEEGMRELVQDQRDHREEERARAAKLYEELGKVGKRLTIIETHLDIKSGDA